MSDQNPEKQLHVTKPSETAAGFGAVKSTMTNAIGKMGVVRATRALLKLNQKGGIDCQSCAWPDPDTKRSVTEFCESGAKALADEGTTKRITPEFFAEYSIKVLAERDDYWLNSQGRLSEPVV